MRKFKRDINHELNLLLQETLMAAQERPVQDRQWFVRESLEYIRVYCEKASKTFVFYELAIACDQYDLGGRARHSATLFHGPIENASIAICVTQRGSLLHRTNGQWQVYCNAGDIAPVKQSALASA